MVGEPNHTGTDVTLDALVEVGAYRSFAEGSDHGLVVLAMGLPYWLVHGEGGYRLLVEPRELPEVRRQLVCFDRESLGWPPPPLPDSAHQRRVDLVTPLLWALVVLAAFWEEAEHPRWVDRGALDSFAVFGHHEWYRAFTALFLHADSGHVISNGLSGILVFAAVTSTFGRLRGWILLTVSAIAGNVLVAALNYPGPYRSIGASTAVFGAVGLLTGRAIRSVLRAAPSQWWRPMFVPFAAGFTVLALYGAGGVHIDVMAHVTGFVAGLLTGFLFGAFDSPRSTSAARQTR